jgi:hypothetical protein
MNIKYASITRTKRQKASKKRLKFFAGKKENTKNCFRVAMNEKELKQLNYADDIDHD